MTRRHIGVIPRRQPEDGSSPRRRRSDADAIVGWSLMALTVALVVAICLGCTQREVRMWADWYAQDPQAALEHAENLPEDEAEPASTSRYGDAVWDRIARCESGGDWSYPPIRNSSGTYSGGLMIGHRWWPEFGGTQFAPYPYLATKAEQIVVAERIADEIGLDRGWQCWP